MKRMCYVCKIRMQKLYKWNELNKLMNDLIYIVSTVYFDNNRLITEVLNRMIYNSVIATWYVRVNISNLLSLLCRWYTTLNENQATAKSEQLFFSTGGVH